MRIINVLGLAALLATGGASSLVAQQKDNGNARPASKPDSTATARTDTVKVVPQGKATVTLFRPNTISHIRPADQRGINVFEPLKGDSVPFDGFALSLGGAFTQEFQGLAHQNNAAAVLTNGVNQNQLIAIGHGFNTAVANLNLNAQLAPGIRVAMTSYLSSRHHNETWVKDGYLLIDDSPIDNLLLKDAMKYVTVRAGQFEINYGDAHFRRSDNGNSIDNPFVGNYVLDAFTTEIGAEVYARSNGLIAMLGGTGGEVHGEVTTPQARSLSVLGKLGFDEQLDPRVRVRLTGSFYANNKSQSNTLYSGDRGGSPYFDVLENTTSTEAANAWSGEIHPGFSNKVNAEVINPFVKIGDAEFFGNFETATGGSFVEPKLRTARQNVFEGLYRVFNNKAYVGARYITVSGELVPNTYTDQTVRRWQTGGGWFLTPSVLTKLEYVTQRYENFAAADIRSGGQFKGFMVTGVVAF